MDVCLLAGGGIGTVVHSNHVLAGLLGVGGLLGGDNNTAFLGGLNTNGLWSLE